MFVAVNVWDVANRFLFRNEFKTKKPAPSGAGFFGNSLVRLLSELITSEPSDNDVLTQLSNLFSDQVFDDLRRILNKRLIHKADLGEVFVEFTFNNFLNGLWRLPLGPSQRRALC